MRQARLAVFPPKLYRRLPPIFLLAVAGLQHPRMRYDTLAQAVWAWSVACICAGGASARAALLRMRSVVGGQLKRAVAVGELDGGGLTLGFITMAFSGGPVDRCGKLNSRRLVMSHQYMIMSAICRLCQLNLAACRVVHSAGATRTRRPSAVETR